LGKSSDGTVTGKKTGIGNCK